MEHAVVMGGASSVGLDAARRLFANGVSISLVDINESSLASVRELFGGTVDTYVANASDFEAIENIAAQITAKHPKVRYLVNTPAANPFIPFREMSFLQIKEVVDVSLTSYAYSIRALWDSFETGGSIVNISSVHGFTTRKGYNMYAAAKAGVESLTRALTSELREKGVRINAVAPGAFISDQFKLDYPDWETDFKRDQISTTEDMTEIVMFLLNEKSKAINGETIIADKGIFTARLPHAQW